MKKTKKNDFSGIVINDSIMLAVEKKKINLRKTLSCLIAVLGFSSLIFSFFSMFSIKCESSHIIIASVIFSVINTVISLKKGRALWFIPVLAVIFGIVLYRDYVNIIAGFKFVYNELYKVSNSVEIAYFKGLSNYNEIKCTTEFIIMCIWFISFVIYFFTIFKPNPIPVVAVSFPILEIGLYHGIDVSVFWAGMLVAYWTALLAVSCCDMGEYDRGGSGFMRKENLFFPKRNMKFKVTERCAVNIICSIMIVVISLMAFINFTDYKRSDSLNQKRSDLKKAINSFSVDDLSESISSITESVGFKLDYEDNRLGRKNSIYYKNSTELTVTINQKYNGAIYLKGYVASVYDDNEWLELKDSVYDKYDSLFTSFDEYNIYPQEFSYLLNSAVSGNQKVSLTIEPKRKRRKSFLPYSLSEYGDIEFYLDTVSRSKKKNKYDCKMSSVGFDTIMSDFLIPKNYSISISDLKNDDDLSLIKDFCNQNDNLLSNNFSVSSIFSPDILESDNKAILSVLMENKYRDFVYDNYLSYPDNSSFDEIHSLFADILDNCNIESVNDRWATLDKIRERIHSNTRYTLSPGKTPSNRDFVNYFLLENGEGYCVHYATAGIMLARMAGIPARYATGYIIVGDDFNDDSKNKDGSYTIKVKDNRSHAWAEVYIDGYGWVPFEFTAGYSPDSIQEATQTEAPKTETQQSQTTMSNAETVSRITSISKVLRSSVIKNTTKSITETNTTTISAGTGGGNVKNKHEVPDFIKGIIISASVLLILLLTVILRRMLIIKIRSKKFKDKNCSYAVIEIYKYTEKLLNILGLFYDGKGYNEFTAKVESKLSEHYFKAGDFSDFMTIALKCKFGSGIYEKSETESARKFANHLAFEIYKKSGGLKKIYLKYILVIL